VNAPKFCNKTR